MKHSFALTCVLTLVSTTVAAEKLTPIESLGKSLFFDTSLSLNEDQSCASCHAPDQGFSAPYGRINARAGVVEGSIKGRFGNRRPPSAAYAANAPIFHHQIENGEVLFVGGAFLDGRATGHKLGSAVADQAGMPFLNPVEMALPHASCVVQKVCSGASGDALAAIWGESICKIDFPAPLAQQCKLANAEITVEDENAASLIDIAFAAISRALASYESSPEVNRFSSRYDRWLAGDALLTPQELFGLGLFEGKALCADCHSTAPGPNGEAALFTDYTYDNLGIPINMENPWYNQAAFNTLGTDWRDQGLAGFIAQDLVYDTLAPLHTGKQKVPTLRNVDSRETPDAPRAYMHNGYFKTLEGVVKFYNTRDVWPRCADELTSEAQALAQQCWPAPEVSDNVNSDELGNLNLNTAQEAALVAFLKTLSDE